MGVGMKRGRGGKKDMKEARKEGGEERRKVNRKQKRGD